MAFPIAPLLSLGGTLLSSITGMGAQQDATNLGWMNYFLQRDNARRQHKLATATRTDALGNRTVFDGDSFNTEVTPLTQAILNASQKEELANLRDDAPRQRAAAVRQDERSKQADDFFQELLNQERFERRPDRRELEARSFLENLNIRKNAEDGSGLSPFINSAIRTGDGDTLRRAINRNNQDIPSFSEIVKASRQESLDEFTRDRGANQSALNEIATIAGIANNSPRVPIAQPNINQQLDNRADQALQTLIGAIQAGSQAQGSALSNLSRQVGSNRGIDWGSILSGVGDIIGNQEPPKSEQQKQLEALILQKQIGDNQIGIHKNNQILRRYG